MGTQTLLPEDLDNLHNFLDLNLPLDPLKDEAIWLPHLDSLPSPNHSQEVSDNSRHSHSLNHSNSSHFPFEDLIFQGSAPGAFLSPASTYSESPPSASASVPPLAQQDAKPTAGRPRSAATGRSSGDGSTVPAAARPKGHRTAAAMERNRRGARKFRERQKQKFADLANRVEMLETELIAMKLCKLKMEADKTSVEEHARQMEKTLATLQGTAAESAEAGDDALAELGAAAVKQESERAYITVPDGAAMPADAQSIKGLSYTQAFAIYKGYVQALRTLLRDLDGESEVASCQSPLQRINELVRDLTIFATRMQATSTVPLWQLYHKQECCPEAGSAFTFEREVLAKLDLSDEQRAQLAAAQQRYRGAFSTLTDERSAINSALVSAAAPGKDGLKKAHEAMWALKGSLAKEPRYTEALLSTCLRALTPSQTARLIVAYFPISVWPDFSALCACIANDAGEVIVHNGPV